jgi:hypothetical protein
MTPAAFRKLALALPDAVAGMHVGRADFRAGGRIFATLGYPDAAWAVVKLAPEQQEMLLAGAPDVFVPVKGIWGARGYTQLRLAAADATTARSALTMAWRGVTATRSKRIRTAPAPNRRSR